MPIPMFASETEELRERLAISALVDDLLEECLREKLSVRASMERVLPAASQRLGACGAAILTRDEELNQTVSATGDLGGHDAWNLLSNRERGAHAVGQKTLVCQPLDVAGDTIGWLGFVFDGTLAPAAVEVALARIDLVAEELDAILATVHAAAEKQALIEQMHQALSNRVFETGLDQAVLTLHGALAFQTLAFVWRDPLDEKALEYRLYRQGHVEFASNGKHHPGLEAAVRDHGFELLSAGRSRLRAALGIDKCVVQVLGSGLTQSEWLGKCLVQPGPKGFSALALDLIRLLGDIARERLVDYNRERRHVGQFFSPAVVSELLREPGYFEKYLRPRDETVALLYADINGFTKLSEQVLEKPSAIGEFVDRWSTGAVDILWKHGGMFDKMVGDCIIGIFGPPFYRDDPAQRAEQALRAAREMVEFTSSFGDGPLAGALKKRPEFSRGLGIAVGVNLCPACVGSFGPNHDLTAFSAGMNSTARLQSLAGFRQIFAMESVVDALQSVPAASDFRFGPPAETAVKNVLKPLRYAELLSKS